MISYEDCLTTFATIEDTNFAGLRAAYLDANQPACKCQDVSVSEFSRGPVEDDEILIRILVAPQHMNARRLPKAGALTDAERNGLSLLRSEATDAEVLAVAKGLVERARRQHGLKAGVFGVLNVECRTIRSFSVPFETERCYCVYDTAQETCLTHAEAFQRVHNVNDAVQDERRRLLFSAVQSTFTPVEKFRNGLLRTLAPAR